MWNLIGKSILRFGWVLLVLLLVLTCYFGWRASKVSLSYEFAKAIPINNPKYKEYLEFRKKFGDDGNLMVIGIRTGKLFQADIFNQYHRLQKELKHAKGVEDVVAVTSAINLARKEGEEKLEALPIFRDTVLSQSEIDSSASVFQGLPFYKGLLYNAETNTWLMGVRLNSSLINSVQRTAIVNDIVKKSDAFAAQTNTEIHYSGLPYIRTIISDRIQKEMRFFLVASVVLSAFILLLFFRSVSAMIISLAVVIIGVIWSIGILDVSGYKITILTALIPPLVVVIGIPNCIYFLNKYHTSFKESNDKNPAIISMIGKMGIVTLFCNIAAAIGFAVFALTESAILKEFGVVAGISIMSLFFISLALIPVALHYLPAPKERHTRYLENKWLQQSLDHLERWSLNHRKTIYMVTLLVLAFAVAGILRLKSVGYIVDDLPKKDKVYADLKFFEENFKGVMPLEVLVDTRKKYGVTRNLNNLRKIDSFVQFLATKPYIGKPLTITEGLKFARQAFFEGDSSSYAMPGENDLIALKPYLSPNSNDSSKTSFSKLVTSFMDSNRQQVRISVSMKDIGSARLPIVLDSIKRRSDQVFDSSKYDVQFTGTSITFLEGTRFIINGLTDSVIWAFLLIALCMLYLFRSWRILICSLIPNLIPLIITAGIMGWAGIALKPSTVLIFSVALGIAIDITIRFLVNYKQQLKPNDFNAARTVIDTIHSTGLSIIYTSIVLIAGFIVFCFSGFGGTKALGWLTSLTLVTATLANLVLLPALLLTFYRKGKEGDKN